MSSGVERLRSLLGQEEEEEKKRRGQTQGAVTSSSSGRERLNRLLETAGDEPANRKSREAYRELMETGTTTYGGKTYTRTEEAKKATRHTPEWQRVASAATAGASQDVARWGTDILNEVKAAEPAETKRKLPSTAAQKYLENYDQSTGNPALAATLAAGLRASGDTRPGVSSQELFRNQDLAQQTAKVTGQQRDRMAADMAANPGLIYDQNFMQDWRSAAAWADTRQEAANRLTDEYNKLTSLRREAEESELYGNLEQNPDFMSHAQGNAETAARADKSISPKMVRYYNIYNRREVRKEAAGSAPAEAYVNAEEAAIYFYLWDTQGSDAAEEYYKKYVKDRAQERRTNKSLEAVQTMAVENPGAMSAASVPLQATGILGMIDLTIQNAARRVGINADKPINYNTGLQLPSAQAEAIRGGVAGKIEDDVKRNLLEAGKSEKAAERWAGFASFAYQTGMSMVDSGVSALLTSVGVPEAATLTLMAGSAGMSSIREAKARGATDGQALAYGYAAAFAEFMSERVSLESLLKDRKLASVKKGWKRTGAAVLEILKQGFTEGSEEANTTLANTITDMLINGDRSELSAKVQALVSSGVSEKEARKAAAWDWLKGIAADAFGGIISGVGMGGPVVGLQLHRANSYDRQMERVRAAFENAAQEQAFQDALAEAEDEAQQSADEGKPFADMPEDSAGEPDEYARAYFGDEEAAAQAQAAPEEQGRAETAPAPPVPQRASESATGDGPHQSPSETAFPEGKPRTGDGGTEPATTRNEGKLRVREESQTPGIHQETQGEKLRVRGNTETGSVVEAMRRVNPEMADAYAGKREDTPLGNAVRAVSNAVKEGTISAEAGAELLNQFWTAGQDEAAREIYLKSMLDGDGNLREMILQNAQKIDAQRKEGLRLGGQAETAPAAEAAGTAGNDLDYGGRGRLSGQRAGEQNGRLEQAKRAIAQPGKAISRRNDTKALRVDAVNAAERIPGAVEGSTITIVPEQVVSKDREMRAVAKRLEDLTGKKVYYILGNIQRKGSANGARGAITADGIYLRCDHNDLTVTQIGAHELYHYYAKQNPGLNARMKEKIIQTFTAEEFNKVAQVYIQKLGRVNGITENMDAEALERAIARIEEEIFADAFGNMNAFGAGADRFTETARSEVNETVGRENAAATEKKTGPPAQFSEDTDADYMAAVDRGDMETAQKMVDEAAKQAGYTIKAYHGTPNKFNVFLKSRIGSTTDYGWFGRGFYFTTEKDVADVYAGYLNDSNVIEAYLKVQNPFVFSDYPGGENMSAGEVMDAVLGKEYGRRGELTEEDNAQRSEDFTDWLRANGYDAAEIWSQIMILDSEQAKRTDPVTYDNDGNIIPLSQRFNPADMDIRWSEDEDIPQSSAEYAQQRNRVPKSSAEYARMRQRELLEEKELKRLENKAKTSEEARKALAEKKRAGEQKELSKEAKAEIKKLEAEIKKRGDEANLRKIFETQGAEALAKEVNAVKRLERKLEKLRNPQEAKTPVKKSTATIAKKQLRNTLMSEFSIPDGSKAEAGQIIDAMADKVLRDGKLTWQDQKALFDKLYNAGVMTVEADHQYQAARDLVRGGRIYVPESVKHEFGDDWNSFRMEALGQGIFLTNDSNDRGADSWNVELASEFPGLFPEDNYDSRDILERIVSAAKAGKEEQMSLAEYAATVVGQDYVSEDDLIDNMERQLDWALRTFADKAGLEVYLKDQTGVKLAEEREKAGKAIDTLRAQQLARQAKEREQRKEAARRQAMNRELREMQQRTLKQLRWLSQNRFKFSGDMRAQVDEILADIDIFAASAADEMHLDAKSGKTWKELRDLYTEARANDPNFLPSKELETIVARLDYQKIGDLDIGALTDLYKAAVGLRTELYNRNNVIADELHQTFQEVYDASKEEIKGAPGGYETGAKGARDAFFNDMQLTPLNRLQRMAGWNPDSKWYGMAKQLEKGERAQRRFKTEATRQLAPVLEQYKDWMKTADGQGKDGKWYEIEVPANWEYRMGDKPVFSNETVKVYMTPAQKVHMYLESKNYDNLRHMEGGRTFADKELYSEGKRSEAFAQGTTVRLLPETVKQIVSDLTEEEQALANALEKFYNEYSKKEINRVSNILYGYDKAMEGSYAPIYTNDNYTKSEPGIFDVTAEGVGNLKSRVVSSNPSLNLSAFDAFEKSVDKTGRFVGMAIPIRNMNTLINWREKGSSMKDVLDHKWGEAAKKWVEDLMTELQSGKKEDVSKIEALTSKALSRYISGVFGANPSIVLKQFASYPLAGAYLGWKNMPLNVIGAAKVDTDLISKYTGEYDYRQLGYATPETATLKDNPGKLQEKGPLNFLFGGGSITWMDGFTVRTLWSWAENKVSREQPDLELGDREQIDAGQSLYYKAVAAEFEEAVSRSQPMYDIMHRSESMRNSSGIARAFTLFKTVPQQEYNMLRQAVGEAEYYKRLGADKETQTKARQKAGRAFLGVLAGNAMIGAITFLNALWKNRGKKYKDEDGNWSTENLIKELGKQFFKDSAGLSIGGSEAVDILSAILFGDKWYDIEMPGLDQTNAIITDAINAGQTITGLVRNSIDVLKSGGNWGQYMADHSEEYLKAVDSMVSTLGTYGTGLPIDNVKAYLLGGLQFISPKIKTAYEDALKKADKSGLKGLTGASLEMRVNHILQDRAKGAEDSTVEELARLYEAGYKDAIPAAQQTKISVGGEDRELNIAQQQTYKNVWSDTVSGALDELVGSRLYQAADDETRKKMLDRLYDLATYRAKSVLFDDYEESALTKAEELLSAGMSTADYVAAVAAYNAVGSEDTSTYERGRKRRDIINALDYSDEMKLQLYESLSGATSRVEQFREIMDSGLDFSAVMDVFDEYSKLNERDDLKAGDKAKEFALWVDTQKYTSKQKETIKDQLVYWQQMSAKTDRYDKLTGTGLDATTAYNLDQAISRLEPETGKSTVSDTQKWQEAVRTVSGEANQKKALQALMTEEQWAKYKTADAAGISPSVYVSYKVTTKDYSSDRDADGKEIKGKTKKDKMLAYIDGLSLTAAQKDVLYYDAGYKESTIDDAPWHKSGGGKGSGSYAPARISVQRKPWETGQQSGGLRLSGDMEKTEETTKQTGSGLRLRGSTPPAAPTGRLRLRAR